MPDDATARPAAIPDGPILVGVDGSENAARAVEAARVLAVALDRELVVLHAVGLMSVIDGEHVPSEGRRDAIQQQVEHWCAPLGDDPALRWRAELVDGPPVTVVTSRADELDASIVVVGSRGIGAGQLLGSTSHHLVHHGDRPVLVVPPVHPTAP